MGRVAATETMPDFTGRTVGGGQYRLLRMLGFGAYGKVYRAADVEAPNPESKYLAVKCLTKPEPGSRTDVLQQREFALHKLVTGHPNIVSFHRHFSDDEFVYVVLDLCSGGDLFAAITERRIFNNNTRLIRGAFLQLIDAVQHCHDLGVFHRDIKPENVLCNSDGTDIRLADFGLSIKSPVCHDFGCGSSYYMSPECIGREITAGNYSTRHNDVWALGVILTNMITGRNPWRYATSEDECFSAYLHDNDFLRQVLPISAGINSLLKRIFTMNPLQRISLPDIRREIVDLQEFYDYSNDRSKKSGFAKGLKYKHRRPGAGVGPKRKPAGSSPATVSCNLPKRATNSDERYVFPSPVLEHSLHPPHHVHPQIHFPDPLDSIHPVEVVRVNADNSIVKQSKAHSSGQSSVPSTGSGSSGPDSKGPITPATYAVEPNMSIPEIPGGEGLGLGLPPFVNFSDVIFVAAKEQPVSPKATKKPRQLLRSAFQRIKGLSSGNSS